MKSLLKVMYCLVIFSYFYIGAVPENGEALVKKRHTRQVAMDQDGIKKLIKAVEVSNSKKLSNPKKISCTPPNSPVEWKVEFLMLHELEEKLLALQKQTATN